ncbi:hypothetical protein [Calidifontibacillus erzurumensis]|uniref:hypothetical protein n=1 Tax=Calidifontibacillus erzurumensis TaxID=2741433 RepID=UPI0035B56550
MKKYSQHEVLQQELEVYKSKFSFINRLFRNIPIRYTIHIPTTVYLRAEVFCADLEEEFEAYLSTEQLITLLYIDFLQFTRRTNDLDTIYNKLATWMPKKKKKARRQIKVYGLGWMENIDVEEEADEENEIEMNKNMSEIIVPIKRKDALRGEVLLADMEQLYPGHGITLEKILEICICDFIHKYTNGDLKNIMKRIVDALS